MNKENKDAVGEQVKLKELQEILKYDFKDDNLLKKALTHSSYSHEIKLKNKILDSNERLEFLGDSVLSLVTSEYIFKKLKDYPEGDLSRIRAAIVCENSLYEYAKIINLGIYLYLGKGEENSNGRSRKSILADAFEALLGSIYIDGGYEQAKIFLYDFICSPVEDILRDGNTKDYKTFLQQLIQQNQGDILQYKLMSEEGPEHRKVFEVNALLNNNVIGTGRGDTKRNAEQNAAKEALSLFGVNFE